MAAQRLAGKVAVITGAASDMGKAIATKFVEHGAKVILADVNFSSCDNIARHLNNKKTKASQVAHPIQCDVKHPSEILRAVKEAKTRYSQDLDIFYNNAGVNSALSTSIGDIQIQDFKDSMAVNVESVIASIQHAGEVMRKSSRGGSILCTGSTMGLLGDLVPSSYTISKAAAMGVIRAAAAELGSEGVRVNAISPHIAAANFDKRVLQQIFPRATAQQLDEMISNNYSTIANPVSVEDVANVAVYLASDESKGVNGHNLVLNGNNKFSIM